MSKKKLQNVNPNTPLVYVGIPGEPLENSLVLGKIYTILYPCYGNFNGTWKPAVYLNECPGEKAYLMALFTHLPRTIK